MPLTNADARGLHAVLLTLVAVFASVVVPALAKYSVIYDGDQTITTFDGFALHADGYRPMPSNATERFPVLIFPNSWACPQIEYIVKANHFAEDGFITLEYETRGWYASGGEIDVAGPLDRRDISTVIDYVLSNADAWQVNASAIAMVGISYGAGLSVEAAGFEPRLATVVSLSGWGNLTQALYRHQTPNEAWAESLVLLADILGHPSPDLSSLIQELISHNVSSMPHIEAYGSHRSAAVNLSFMNARRIPMFISNNFLDRLFMPNDMVEFWTALEVPKFLLLNQGMHAYAELWGLLDIPHNYVWDHAKRWLQYFLQGIDTGIMDEAPVQMQVEYEGDAYIALPTWPDVNRVQEERFFFGNRGDNHYGQLQIGSAPAPVPGPTDVVYYNELSGIYDGIPILSDALNELVPTTNQLLVYVESGAIVYMGAAVTNTTRYCGTPTFQVSFIPSSTTWQMFAFLYDVDPLDLGEVISDAYQTSWGADPENNATVTLRSSFHMLCHDIPTGHRIAVGFALYNAAYPNPNPNLNVIFFYDNNTWVSLPWNPW